MWPPTQGDEGAEIVTGFAEKALFGGGIGIVNLGSNVQLRKVIK